MRKVFKIILAYDGPFLQGPRMKKEACFYLQEEGLGPHFLDTFDSVGKWEWLKKQILRRRFFRSSRARFGYSRKRRVTAWWRFCFCGCVSFFSSIVCS